MEMDSYVLITAARNEAAYVRQTLQSVVGQTLLPKVWVIVSDGSTDATDDIVMEFARAHPFIRLIRLSKDRARDFASKVIAENIAYESIRYADFAFVGFLDADISFEKGHYEALIGKFKANPRLGIAGSRFYENGPHGFRKRAASPEDHVPGAVQFFRRDCYEGMGGFLKLKYGGEDSVANAMARRNGWEVRSFFDLHVYHHRPTGTAGTSVWRARFRQGKADYFMGYHALYEFGKCIRRIVEPPLGIGSLLRFCGYLVPGITFRQRVVSKDFVRYLRQEQMRRLWNMGRQGAQHV